MNRSTAQPIAKGKGPRGRVVRIDTRIKRQAVRSRDWLIYKKLALVASRSHRPLPFDPTARFVVSMASYPGRIHLVPAVFESLARQSVMPRHGYLVLSEEDWPARHVPEPIARLTARGVQIIWTRNNPYAVKKLMPILHRHPDLGVVTVDDDMFYGETLMERVVGAAGDSGDVIAGYLGKALYRCGDQLGMMFRESVAAGPDTPSERLYLFGCGTYYPPNALHPSVLDLEAVTEIVPGRGSDIWFWAAAVAAGTKQVCLGGQAYPSKWAPIPQPSGSCPRDSPGGVELERRFHAAIDFFGIRERLLTALPEGPSC